MKSAETHLGGLFTEESLRDASVIDTAGRGEEGKEEEVGEGVYEESA